jgi:hypothetical protein
VAVAATEATVEPKPSALMLGVERALMPAAARLGAMPEGTRQTIGWVGVVTFFWAVVVWVGALVFMGPPKLPEVEGAVNLHVPGQEGAAANGRGAGAGKGESHGHAAMPAPKAAGSDEGHVPAKGEPKKSAHADASHGGH